MVLTRTDAFRELVGIGWPGPDIDSGPLPGACFHCGRKLKIAIIWTEFGALWGAPCHRNATFGAQYPDNGNSVAPWKRNLGSLQVASAVTDQSTRKQAGSCRNDK